jgi:hypothetical protein
LDASDDSKGTEGMTRSIDRCYTARGTTRVCACDNQRECVTLSFSGKRTTSRLDGDAGRAGGTKERFKPPPLDRRVVVET